MEYIKLFFAISGVLAWSVIFWYILFPSKVRNDDYEEMHYCSDCHRNTLHLHHCNGHERDSSEDYKICLTCKKMSR